MQKSFFRVCNPATQQGLWYHFDGSFAGLIHGSFSALSNSALRMDYDPELVGWLSATETLEVLWKWFTPADLALMEPRGWFIHEYQATDWKFYERFQHPVICQVTSKLLARHPIASLTATA